MNDLAEKALHELNLVRRGVSARPAPVLATLGFGAAAGVMTIGARLGAAPDAVPINRWAGLLPGAGYVITTPGLGFAMLATILALIGVWLVSVWLATRDRLSRREVWSMATVWAVPFAVGPPLLSTDLYAAVARGLLARNGLNPYHHAPLDLGAERIVGAIDPTWRGAKSSDGPLATLVQHLAVSVAGGHATTALLGLRALAIIAVAVIGYCAVELSGGRGPVALSLTVLNPMVLLFVVSAGEFAGLFAAVVLAGFVAVARRRWAIAIVLVCMAAGLKPVGLIVLPVVIAAHVLAAEQQRLRTALRDVGLAALVLVVSSLVVPNGLGWLWNLNDAIHEHVPFAPASVLAYIVGWMVPAANYDDLQTGGRISAAAAAVTAVAYLYVTMRRRPPPLTAALALLIAAVLAPVVYPSSLLIGLVCLAPLGAYREWVIALSCAACVLTPVGFGERGAQFLTLVCLVVIALALVGYYLRTARRGRVAEVEPADMGTAAHVAAADVSADVSADVRAGESRSARPAPGSS